MEKRLDKQVKMSRQTRQNWLIDAAVFIGASLAILTGIYFLFLPSGGYEGGRNPAYGLTLLFGRATWDDMHTWGGVLMIIAVVVHFAIHWAWVKRMSHRVWQSLRGGDARFSSGARLNLVVDTVIGLSFLITAVSSIYFLFLPTGYQGGRTLGWDPGFLFTRTTWDLIHTWSAVIMIVAAIIHFVIHWRWVVNVTQRFFLSLRKRATAQI